VITLNRDDLDKKSKKVFATNELYFQMMSEFHDANHGLAVEDEVKNIIEENCRNGGRILEAGCGEGSITNWFASRHRSTRFIGIDISPIGISMARRTALPNASFYVGDITQIGCQSGAFDFVLSHSVIEHVQSWQKFLREARRILVPGGSLLVRVGNGGVQGVSRKRAFLRYLLHQNRTIYLNPTFSLDRGNYRNHQSNFDVVEIPSDELTREMKLSGFKIGRFTTGTRKWSNSSSIALRIAAKLRFWPFSHLGGVTIILGNKPK
jgi:ubiquinone/menaquinone biosynthesis C-methylase UbiE